MASTDTTTKSEQPGSSKVDKEPETQDPSTDPSTVGEASEPTDPATKEILQEATSNDWEYVSNWALIKHR